MGTAMDPDRAIAQDHNDPAEVSLADTVDLDQAHAVKAQGERLLEESRSLTSSSRALLEEIDPSSV